MGILSFGVPQCLRIGTVTMTRIGYEHVDRLISYPYLHNLSANAQPIRMSERHRGNGHLFADPLRAASIAAFAVFRLTPVRSL